MKFNCSMDYWRITISCSLHSGENSKEKWSGKVVTNVWAVSRVQWLFPLYMVFIWFVVKIAKNIALAAFVVDRWHNFQSNCRAQDSSHCQMSFLSVNIFFKGVCSGIVRGSGRQTIGVLINFVAYCCIGLPCGITLMFLVFHEITGKGIENCYISVQI